MTLYKMHFSLSFLLVFMTWYRSYYPLSKLARIMSLKPWKKSLSVQRIFKAEIHWGNVKVLPGDMYVLLTILWSSRDALVVTFTVHLTAISSINSLTYAELFCKYYIHDKLKQNIINLLDTKDLQLYLYEIHLYPEYILNTL